jgi:hypothetical protein
MSACDIKQALDWAVVLFTFLAALFWFWSAWAGIGALRPAPINVPNPLFQKQAMLNAVAAGSAGVAAICQLATLWFPLCRAFS